ncbi:ribulose-phosphate 3-epimerase [Candidatus Dependentiae bacterium]
MKKKVTKISASVICANWMNLQDDLQCLEQEGIDYLHYDIMDGFFCPDYCLGSQLINIIRKNTAIASDYHLMVEEPTRMLKYFIPKNGDIFTIHYEACKNLHRDIMLIKKSGFKASVALNPATPISVLEYVIRDLDIIQVMTVDPGSAGQKLVPQTIHKISLLDAWRKRENLKFEIISDGNVSLENAFKMVSLGSDILVGGSSGMFLEGLSLDKGIKKFKNSIENKKVYRASYARNQYRVCS